jgi:predicted ATPase
MPAHPTLCQPIATLDPADAKRWPSAEAAVAFANATHPNIVKQGFEVVEVEG